MDMLDRTFKHTADGVFVIDEDQNIIYWNQSAQKILGYASDEVMGQSCFKILCGCDDKGHAFCHQHCGVRAAAVAGKTVTNYDLATRTKAGELRWINVSILTIFENDASRPVVVHLFRDATQSKQNEQFIHQMFDTVESYQQTAPPVARPTTPLHTSADSLTDREHQVLTLLARGSTTANIAQTLSISPTTVRNHVQSILHKLNVHSRLEAVAYAFEHGLIVDDE